MGKEGQVNFHVSPELKEKFSRFCEELGISQVSFFENMLESAMELEQVKSSLPQRATEIVDMEQHLKAISVAYIHSLALNFNAETRVRAEFERQIASKEQLIASLQEHLRAMGDECEQLRTQTRAAEEKAATVDKLRENLAARERQVKDQADHMDLLSYELYEKNQKASDFDEALDELRAAHIEMKEQKHAHELAMERAAREAEQAKEKAVRAVEEACAVKINDLQEKLQRSEREHSAALMAVLTGHKEDEAI